MKNFRLLTLLLPIFFLGCDDEVSAPDDLGNFPQHADVKYAVTASADIVSTVQYRLATGVYADADSPDSDWAATVPVEKPFNASMFVQFQNTTTTAQTYSLLIYVDDALATIKSGTVAPATIVTDSAVIDVPETE